LPGTRKCYETVLANSSAHVTIKWLSRDLIDSLARTSRREGGIHRS
jgi:hypothetical protein